MTSRCNHASSLLVPLALAYSMPAHAQHFDDDAIRSAKDIFGLTVGPESLGLYTQDSVRGFSPLVAGNARIDGLYFDQRGTMTSRLMDGSEIQVGVSALGYPFPAPTGIVDWKLREIRATPSATAILYAGPFATYEADLDGQTPVLPNLLGISAGLGYRYDAELPGYTANIAALGVSSELTPNDHLQIRAFFGRRDVSTSFIEPIIYSDGVSLPPRRTRHFFGQEWIQDHHYADQSGLLTRATLSPTWSARAGVFLSNAPALHSFDEIYVDTHANGVGDHQVVAYPRQDARSISGEARLTRLLAGPIFQQKIDLGVRYRRSTAAYGGTQVFELGPASVAAPPTIAQPQIVFGQRTDDAIRQTTLGAGYSISWRGHIEATFGLQRADYHRDVAAPDLAASAARMRPWLYNGSVLQHLGTSLVAYASYTRGLEDAGGAPANATNRGAVLGAELTSQRELGVRYAVTDRSALIAAAFDIEKPYFGLSRSGLFARQGVEQHRGLELSAAGEVVSGLQIVAGAMFMSPSVSADSLQANSSIAAVGQTKRLVQFYADYRLPRQPRVSIDIAVVNQAPQIVSADGALRTPPLTTVAIGGRYRWKMFSRSASLRVQLNNVTNAYNWTVDPGGGLTPIQPINLLAYLTVDL